MKTLQKLNFSHTETQTQAKPDNPQIETNEKEEEQV